MIVSKGNIVFRRLTHDDIELVRQMRNSPEINSTMVYTDFITPEMQEKWFKSVNNIYNFYFIIENDGKKVGLINGKNIDWETRTMEAGIFYWDKSILKSQIPALCSLIFAELGLLVFDLTATAKIRKDNKNAIRFNKLIGFVSTNVETVSADNEIFNTYILNKENYLKRAKVVRKAFQLLLGSSKTRCLVEPEDYASGFGMELEKRLPKKIVEQAEQTKEGKVIYF